MKNWIERGCFALISATSIGCGSNSSGTDTENGSSGENGTSTTQASQATTSSTGESATGTPTTGHLSHSGSATDTTTDTTTDATTVDVTATDTLSSSGGTEPGTTTDGTTTISTTAGETTTTGDTTAADTTTGETTNAESSTTEPDCIPSLEVCNDLDDDCDGNIDNVDVGGDGICDCLDIALLGNQGANPSAEFQGWLEAQGTQVDRIHTNPADVLDKATVSKYDIIILDYMVRSYTADEAATMQTWVEAGGGLMAMTGFTNAQFAADRPNSLIKPMGLSYNTSKGFFSGPIVNFLPHPITMGLTSISFYGGLFIDIVQDGFGKNAIIMNLMQGPVGVVQDRGNGRLFIFGDEWIEFDSEWKNIPEIQKFWVQTLSWLGPKNSCLVPL